MYIEVDKAFYKKGTFQVKDAIFRLLLNFRCSNQVFIPILPDVFDIQCTDFVELTKPWRKNYHVQLNLQNKWYRMKDYTKCSSDKTLQIKQKSMTITNGKRIGT